MRILFVFAVFLLFFQGSFAALVIPGPASEQSLVRSPKKPLYEKGKGTMGFISGLVLGPVGLAGVHLLSHNRTMRKQAGKGCMLWVYAAIAALCIVFIFAAFSGKSKGSGLRGSHLGDEGTPKDKQKKPVTGEREIAELPLFLQP